MRIAQAVGHLPFGRWRLVVTTLVVACCTTMALAIGGPAVAGAASPTWSDYQSDPFDCSPVETHAEARIKRVYLSGGGYTRSLQVTIQTHIGPNPHWVVGCDASVFVDVVGDDGTIMASTPAHIAHVGAVFDPIGNNKNYTWVDVLQNIDDEKLDRINHLDVRHAAH
jgi:hypothetical protein